MVFFIMCWYSTHKHGVCASALKPQWAVVNGSYWFTTVVAWTWQRHFTACKVTILKCCVKHKYDEMQIFHFTTFTLLIFVNLCLFWVWWKHHIPNKLGQGQQKTVWNVPPVNSLIGNRWYHDLIQKRHSRKAPLFTNKDGVKVHHFVKHICMMNIATLAKETLCKTVVGKHS